MSKSRGLADLGNAYSDGALSNRNLIINGAMQVAQRGTSFTGLTSSGYRACDRFIPAFSSLGTWTVSQSTDAPEGFANSYKLECTTADASPAAADYVFFDQRIEGQNLQHLKKGTANALPVTLSFWVKSNKTGNFQTNLHDADNGRAIASVVTINTADAWEYKTITFAGDTTGTLDNDNSTSLRVEMWLDVGTNWSSGATPTAWEPLVSADRGAGTDLGLGDSTSNYWAITGVQLEVGDTATPFEHRSYSDELQRCQRFYFEARKGSYPEAYHYYARNNTAVVGNVPFPVTMRATPSVTLNSNGVDNRAVRVDTAALVTFSPVQSWWTKDAMAGLYDNVNTPFVSGESYGIGIKADAEL